MMARGKVIKYAFLALIAISLMVFLWVTDYDLVITQLQEVGVGFLGLILISGASYLLGALAWYVCLPSHGTVSVWQVILVRTIGENISIFNPTTVLAGEVSKFHLLRDESLTVRDKMDSILFSRMIMIVSQIMLSLVGVLWLAHRSGHMLIAIAITGAIAMILMVVIGVSAHIARMATKRKRLPNPRWMRRATIEIRRAIRAFLLFKSQRTRAFYTSFLFSALHWIIGAAEIYWILFLLGMSPVILDCLAVDMGVVVVKSIGSIVPGQLGVEELGNKWMLAWIGMAGTSIWVTVSILRRSKQLVWIILSIAMYYILKYFLRPKSKCHGNIVYNT